MSVLDKGPLVATPVQENQVANLVLTFTTDPSKVQAYQAAIQRRGKPIVIPCPLWTANIPDPNWVDPHDGSTAPLIPNPVSLTQFAQDRVRLLINTVILEDANTQGDAAVKAQQAVNAAALQTLHDSITQPAVAIAALDINIAQQVTP